MGNLAPYKSHATPTLSLATVEPIMENVAERKTPFLDTDVVFCIANCSGDAENRMKIPQNIDSRDK